MANATAVKVTRQGVLIPRPLIATWGEIQEVEIELRGTVIIVKPFPVHTIATRKRIVDEMKAAGLVEEMPWTERPVISPKKRAALAKRLGRGKPLSEMIIEDRDYDSPLSFPRMTA